jgi:UDP-2,3-diacylglucosamine pyrophosphatase LpxH
MLIFISDLHFTDGSAGEHNVPDRAFGYFLEDIARIAAKPTNQIQEIKLVFLGDIFDLLRTEHWFACQPEERPWGNNDPLVAKHAEAIFKAITQQSDNAAIFKLLSSSLKDTFNLPVEPERLFIPGNHDRLINKFQSLREQVCQLLSLGHDPTEPFPDAMEFPEYGVFTRHGHQYDYFNYEPTPETAPAFDRVPIGDPITTELITKLSHTLGLNLLPLTEVSPYDKRRLKKNFQEIENIRPLAAVLKWLLYQVQADENQQLRSIIERTVDQVIQEFNCIPFVQEWKKTHCDLKALGFKAALWLLEKIDFLLYRGALSFLIRIAERWPDALRSAAATELDRLNPDIRYVVYGHSHEPLVLAVRTLKKRQYHYLNTGTWRTRYHKASQDNSFIGWKDLTYVIFYKPGERQVTDPVFETWMGNLKTL